MEQTASELVQVSIWNSLVWTVLLLQDPPGYGVWDIQALMIFRRLQEGIMQSPKLVIMLILKLLYQLRK